MVMLSHRPQATGKVFNSLMRMKNPFGYFIACCFRSNFFPITWTIDEKHFGNWMKCAHSVASQNNITRFSMEFIPHWEMIKTDKYMYYMNCASMHKAQHWSISYHIQTLSDNSRIVCIKRDVATRTYGLNTN